MPAIARDTPTGVQVVFSDPKRGQWHTEFGMDADSAFDAGILFEDAPADAMRTTPEAEEAVRASLRVRLAVTDADEAEQAATAEAAAAEAAAAGEFAVEESADPEEAVTYQVRGSLNSFREIFGLRGI